MTVRRNRRATDESFSRLIVLREDGGREKSLAYSHTLRHWHRTPWSSLITDANNSVIICFPKSNLHITFERSRAGARTCSRLEIQRTTWPPLTLLPRDLWPPRSDFFQELGDLRASAMKNFTNIQVDESNILTWQGLILPVRLRHPPRSSRTYVT